MKRLTVDLENCYGIKKLKAEFDFSEGRAFAIYAPNGAMKSSFAETFKDVADGKPSRDRVFPARKCQRSITDDTGADLPAKAVMVIRPYEEVFGCNEETLTLLVDPELRKQYEQLHGDLNKAKAAFLAALKAQSGSRKDLEREISLAFTHRDKQFYAALDRVRNEVLAQPDAPFADIQYDVIFNDKVLEVLATKDFKSAIDGYVKRYNQLLDKSTYFKKGVFNYYNASQIARTLAANGFFNAKHTVHLNADTVLEITDEKQLERLIAKELEGIASDEQLRKQFADLQKILEKNETARDFRNYISNHEDVLPQLENIEAFRQDLLKSYFKARLDSYRGVLDQYELVQERSKEIERVASGQRTQWQEAIDIFNGRFFVPFKLEAKNQFAVMVGADKILSLGFTFADGADQASLEHKDLMQVLSTGEKKALYILNIIFDIEVRKKAHTETIFVVDDVADSFDYKNKYAIIQYLKDIHEEPYFHQLILTHNFDFFRTVESRFVKYSHCRMAFRDSTGVELRPATGIRNVFVNDWKKNYFTEPAKKIAAIPFIRNIIEYTKGDQDADYIRLTSLLHWKADSEGIVESDLDAIYKKTFGNGRGTKGKDGKRPVVDIIRAEAEKCLNAGAGVNFENKIVMSIAIRLAAERFMIGKIADASFVASIEAHQTSRLFERFRKQFPGETGTIEALERVVLMTPENIHLNSFMYEPILDMSDEHLRELYRDVVAL